MSKKKNRPHGHYCKICGEYKANFIAVSLGIASIIGLAVKDQTPSKYIQ